MAIVDVGHLASGQAARAPTSTAAAGPHRANGVQLPGTDLRAYHFASYSCCVQCRRAYMLYFRGFCAPCYEAYQGP